jgi:hypothetical protein
VNGAQALLKALVDAGLDICFANPGTSEMQLASSPVGWKPLTRQKAEKQPSVLQIGHIGTRIDRLTI